MLIRNARVVTPDAVLPIAAVRVAGGVIETIDPQRAPVPPAAAGEFDAHGGTLLPGFVDLHNHGALGYDTMDRDAGSWRVMCKFLARHGVTGFLPTSTAASSRETMLYIDLARAIMAEAPDGARILGVHLEGPYLNSEFAGMQPRGQCRAPDPSEYIPWLQTGIVRRMTAALELPGSRRLAADCAAAGVCVSLGHTACTAEDVPRYAQWGAKHVTHLYNAMSRAEKQGPVRVCGCLEGALTTDALAAEIIGDGNHVPEHLFRIAFRCKGPDRLAVASDATPFTGAAEEGVPIRYGGAENPQEMVVRGGRAISLDGSSLVGSVATLGDMFQRILAWLDGDLPAAAKLFSTNPARLIGLGARKGKIQPGFDADLVLLDADLRVCATWVGGEEVGSCEL